MIYIKGDVENKPRQNSGTKSLHNKIGKEGKLNQTRKVLQARMANNRLLVQHAHKMIIPLTEV